MKIVHLADATEHIPILADWFARDWPAGSSTPQDGRPVDHAADFRGCARRELPLNLVALDGDTPIGTVFLLESVARVRGAGGPWIEGLYVVPDRRHRGIALALVSRALEIARSLSFPRAFIGVRSAIEVYQARGWRCERMDEHPDGPITVLSRSTEPEIPPTCAG
jgi:GNAT superfamily N-acetyltransferase